MFFYDVDSHQLLDEKASFVTNKWMSKITVSMYNRLSVLHADAEQHFGN